MTVDAPAHVERVCLRDLLHVLDVAVTCLTRYSGVDVAHVGKVHVLRELVDSDPRYRLLPGPEAGELLYLGLGRSDNGMASHAGTDRGETGIGRFVGGEMTVDAVHLQRPDMNRMGKCNGLCRAVPLGR